MQKSNQNKAKKIQYVTVHTMGKHKRQPIYSDVNGSYTGRPINGGKPIQDADDL